MPIEKIIERQDKLPVKSRKWIIRTTERYLASVDAWVVCDEHDGHNFVESTDPEVEIMAFMQRMDKVYVCPRCQATMLAEDEDDHVGEKCPQCKLEKALTKKHDIDAEKNMRRIRRLMKWRDAQ